MTNDRTLTLTYDEDAGQVVLESHPAGPAGEAPLNLATGVELFFDGADGRLSRIVIDAGEPGGAPVVGEAALADVASLFGARARDAVEHAPSRDGNPLTLTAEPQIMTAMSRLARLGAARSTSPVAGSPLWAVEAAQLARQAGLAARVNVPASQPGQASAGSHPRRQPLGKPDVTGPRPGDQDVQRGHKVAAPPGWLDPHLVPPGVFQHAVRPDAELTIRSEPDRVLVEASLAPHADPGQLARCRVRLVDPANRAVVMTAEFERREGSRLRAEISGRIAPGAWVEVVDDVSRPVFSRQLHHIRRAMRWAQAALTATRQVCGVADAEWAKLAADAWGRCAYDWSAAGDEDRAYLAAVRQAALCPGVSTPEASSTWAKEVAGRPLLREQPFLAERAGGRP